MKSKQAKKPKKVKIETTSDKYLYKNPKVDDKFIDECKILSGLGMTYDQIADYFQISPKKWDLILDKNARIRVALKQGRAGVIGEICGLLVEKARSGNVTAMIFYLKCQAGFKDGSHFESMVDRPKTQFSITTADPVEAARVYQTIMTGS